MFPLLLVEPREHSRQPGQPPVLGDDEVQQVHVLDWVSPGEVDLCPLVPTVAVSLGLVGNLEPDNVKEIYLELI